MSATRPCPECGAPLPDDSPEGNCPSCLMRLAAALAEDRKAECAELRRTAVLLCCHLGVNVQPMRTLTIKLKPEQDAWLEKQAKALKRSKGEIVRELIDERQAGKNGSLGQGLADLCGSLCGSKDLSTRDLKGYGRR